MAKKKSSKRKSSADYSGIIRLVLGGVGIVAVLAMCGGVFYVGSEAMRQAREAARRAQERGMAGAGLPADPAKDLDNALSNLSRNETQTRLQQMGKGLHNFHDAYAHFPPMGVAAAPYQGETPHAWMTDLLPFVGQAELSKSVNRKADWMDPSQGNVFKTIVANYLIPSAKFNTDADGYAISYFAANSQVISDSKFTHFQEILDGTSNTMLVGTVTDGLLPWGNPMNHRDGALGFGGGPQAFGAPFNGVALVLLADGSVKAIRSTIAPEVAQKLANPTDGQPLDWDREVSQ